jgi:hypothetical protein
MNITLTQRPNKVDAGTQSMPQFPRMASLPLSLEIESDRADFADITVWTFAVASSYAQLDTPLLFVDSGFTVNDKTVSFSLTTNTDELAAYLGDVNKKNAVAQLRGFTAGDTNAAVTVSFYVTLCNIIPDGSSTSPVPSAQYYTAIQTDAAIATAISEIDIPTDISDLTDNSVLLFSGDYNDLSNTPAIPVDLNDLTDSSGLLFSGDYDALINKPTIPTDLNDLNDVDDKLHGPVKEVTSLPSTPIAGQLVRLTTADDTAKAAPGVYMHDGVGWTCISYESAYALGNLGATPSLTLIPGASYTATVNAEITTFTVAFTRPGLASITLTNADTLAVAQPAMAGRTSKLLADGAWDGVATALSKALLEDDGVYLIVSAGGLA